MSTLRQAAQDLLDKIYGLGASPLDWPEHSALEAALAAPEQEPVAWTLTSTLTKRETTTTAYLWFTNPVNCSWSPLYATPVDIEALTKERDELLLQIDIQGGSIDAVQAANQRLFASIKDCVKRIDEALRDTADLAVERDKYRAKYNECYEVLNDLIKERDALMVALKQTLSSMGQQADTLRAERDALMAAAKLALNTLEQGGMLHRVQAITALKKAGVAQ